MSYGLWGGRTDMYDYKKFLAEEDFSDNQLEVFQTEKTVEMFGTKKELLYLACRIIEYVKIDCDDCDIAELNFDSGVDLTRESSSFRIFLKGKNVI